MDLAGPSELGTLVSSVSDFFLSANLEMMWERYFLTFARSSIVCDAPCFPRRVETIVLLKFYFFFVLFSCWTCVRPFLGWPGLFPRRKKTNSKNLNRVCTYLAYFLLNLSAEQKNTGIPILLKR